MKKLAKVVSVFVLMLLIGGLFCGCSLNPPTKIEAVLNDVNLEVAYNQELDLENLKIKATYRDGRSAILDMDTEGMEIDYGEFDKTTPGIYSICVTFRKQKTCFEVRVLEPEENGFRIDRSLIPQQVDWGEMVDFSRLKVFSTSKEGVEKELKVGEYTLTHDFNSEIAGVYEIVVGYKNFEVKTFSITVNPASVYGLKLDISNVQKEFEYGEEFNHEGLKVYEVFESGEQTEISDFNIDSSNFNNSKSGEYQINISYGEYEPVTYSVAVLDAPEVGFRVDRSGVEENLPVGSEIDFGKVKVYSILQDGSEVLLDSGYEVDYSQYNKEVPGVYEIFVRYNQHEAQSFSVTLRESAAAINEVDKNRLVVFENMHYTFTNQITKLVNQDGVEFIPDNPQTFPPLPVGDYTLYYKNSQGEDKTYGYRVVDYLTTFSKGADYLSMEDHKQDVKEGALFLKADSIYQVGVLNDFSFDLNIQTMDDEKVVIADDRILDYEFFEKDGDDWKKLEIDAVAQISGDKFKFNQELVGKVLKAIISAKYHSYSDIEFVFQLNDGINVFNHEDLKENFSNLNISKINIHRDITPAFSSSQLNPDGSVKNINYSKILDYIEYNEDGSLKENNTGNIYVRVGETGDNLEVFGNNFVVYGRELPLIGTNSNGYLDQPTYLYVGSDTGDTGIANVQTSMFFVASKDEVEENKNKVIFNNLAILSNTQAPAGNNDEENMRWVRENSGGLVGIRAKNVDLDINSSTIKFTCIGAYMNGPGSDVKLEDSLIDESWANNIYSYGGSKVELLSSKLLTAGGGAVWLEDVSEQTGDYYNPSFVMDETSVISNFVSGSEAWFAAYGLGDLATSAKANVEGIVSSATNGTKTIIKTEKNPSTGLESEVFNFAVVIVDKFSSEYQPEEKSVFTIGENRVERKLSELSQDPRNTTSGFVSPVGKLSSTQNYLARVQELMQGGLGQSDAGGQAFAESFMDENTRYLEIIQSVAGVGQMTIITSFI